MQADHDLETAGTQEENGVLDRQIAFLEEIDRLKGVVRASPLIDGSRRENSAEHSWHLAMYALVLAGHADEPVDPCRVVTMLLVHDIVEIDAGDTPIHGGETAGQAERERLAAERLFGLLPGRQGADLKALWHEFEAADSADARFARSLDRLQPLIHNLANRGGTWREAGLAEQQVIARYGPTIGGGSQTLWQRARELVQRHFAGG